MNQEQLEKHVDHLKGVIRQSRKNNRAGYNHLVQGIAIAFQNVAPDNKEVQQLARRLNKAQFDEDGDQENIREAEQVQQQAGQLGQNRSQPGGNQKGEPVKGDPARPAA